MKDIDYTDGDNDGDDDECIRVWVGCSGGAAWASASQRQGQSTRRRPAAAGLDQSEAGVLGDRPSALIVDHRAF